MSICENIIIDLVVEKIDLELTAEQQTMFRGENGEDGADGYTPIKGVDYFTQTDKIELENGVKAAIYDENIYLKASNQAVKTDEDVPVSVDDEGKLWTKTGDTQIIVNSVTDLPLDVKAGTSARVLTDYEAELSADVTELYEGQFFKNLTIKENIDFSYLEGAPQSESIFAVIGNVVIQVLNFFGDPFMHIQYSYDENGVEVEQQVVYTPVQAVINIDGMELTIPAGWHILNEDFTFDEISYEDIPVVHQSDVYVEEAYSDSQYLFPCLSTLTNVLKPKGEYVFNGENWEYVNIFGIVTEKYSELPKPVITGTIGKVLQDYTEISSTEPTELLESNEENGYLEYDNITIKETMTFNDVPTEINYNMRATIGSMSLELNNMFGATFLVINYTYMDYSVNEEGEEVSRQVSYIPEATEITLPAEITGGDELVVTIPAGWNIINDDFTFEAINYADIPNMSQSKVSVSDLGESYQYLLQCLILQQEIAYNKGLYSFNGESWEICKDFVQTQIEMDLSDSEKETARSNIDALSVDEAKNTFVSVESQYFGDYEKTTARDNIGAGTSNFSGDYEDLTNKPIIPTNSDFTLSGLGEKSYYSLTDTPQIPTNSDFTLSGLSEQSFYSLTNKPNSLFGYGITDAVDTTSSQFVGGSKFFTDTTYMRGDVYFEKNMYQNGAIYETHAEHLKVRDSLIHTRNEATSGLSSGEVTGIQATKYDGINNGQLVFDVNGVARVGDVGNLQPLATREETPTDTGIARWNSEDNKFITELPDSEVTKDSDNLITSGAVEAYAVPYENASADVNLGSNNLSAKNIGANSNNSDLRLNVVGDGVTDRLPITFNPTEQEKSQTVGIQGNGTTRLWISNNNIYGKELNLGVDNDGNGYISAAYGNSLLLKTNNLTRLELKYDGRVYVNGRLIIDIITGSERPDINTFGDYIGQFYLYNQDQIGKLYYLAEIYSNPTTGLDEYRWKVIDSFTTNNTTGFNSYISNNKDNQATGNFSLAVNSFTTASGTNSMACGLSTTASRYNSFACGENSKQNDNAIFIVGDGIDPGENAHNIVEVETGKVKINGDLEVSGSMDLGELAAEDVTYDNTTSGLNATEVKGAIDTLKGLVDNLDEKTVDKIIVSSNANNLTVTGFYSLSGTATGVPDSSHSWFLIHQNASTGSISATQRACGFGVQGDVNKLLVYQRTKYDGSWGSWLRIQSVPIAIPFTLSSAGWTNNEQTVALTIDTTARNVVDVNLASLDEYENCGIRAIAETNSSITFSCVTVPQNDLSGYVIPEIVKYA